MTMSNAQREGVAATQLVARAQAGDAEAFAELVRRYRKRIFALALHLTKSASEADDIAQDVFLKAYRALDQFEGRSEFFTWVYRMAVNRSLNCRRDRARHGQAEIDDPRLELAVAADAKGDPRRAAELRQTYGRLLRSLDSLPPDMRTTVVLVALQGFSHAEAGVVQKVSEGTIAWRMHEARRRLATSLGKIRLGGDQPLSLELSRVLVEHGLPLLAAKPS